MFDFDKVNCLQKGEQAKINGELLRGVICIVIRTSFYNIRNIYFESKT
jgi:hypothetical protein